MKYSDGRQNTCAIGYYTLSAVTMLVPIGNCTLSAVTMFAPIRNCTLSAVTMLAPIGNCTLSAVTMLAPIRNCTLSAVRVLAPIGNYTLSAVTMLPQSEIALCRPTQCLLLTENKVSLSWVGIQRHEDLKNMKLHHIFSQIFCQFIYLSYLCRKKTMETPDLIA